MTEEEEKPKYARDLNLIHLMVSSEFKGITDFKLAAVYLENRTRKVMRELRLLQRVHLSTRDKKAVARLKKETEQILRDIKDSRKAIRLAERLQKKSKRTKRPRKR